MSQGKVVSPKGSPKSGTSNQGIGSGAHYDINKANKDLSHTSYPKNGKADSGE